MWLVNVRGKLMTAEILKQAGRLFRKCHRARVGDLARERLRTSMGPVRREVRKWLEAGARCARKKTRLACANILKGDGAQPQRERP